MSNKSSLSRFEIIENESDEFIAVLQIRNVCASIERTKAGYVPTVSDNEWGESVSKGQALATAELAAESALSLVRGYFDAMARAFAGFPTTGDVVLVRDALHGAA